MRPSPSLVAFWGLAAVSPLAVAAQNPVVLTGTVVDAAGGAAIPEAVIRVNGRDMGHTDERGRFRIGASLDPADSPHTIAAVRIGYLLGQRQFTLEAETITLDFVIRLEAAPVEIEEINVEAEALRTNQRMAGFLRRRETTPGYFFTRDDIRKIGAQRLTEVVRRVPGTVIFGPDNVHVNPTDPTSRETPFEQPTIIQFQRQGYARGAPCQPLIFVNDVAIMDRNIDWLVPSQSIIGLEVYTSTSQVPAEYNKAGASCGALVVWTDGELRQRGNGLVSVMEVGGGVSWRVRDGLEGERFGLHLAVPVTGWLEFHPNFNLIVGNTADGDAGWQISSALKVRPFGRGTPLYVGTGGTIIKNRTSFFESGRRNRDDTAAHLLGLAGLSVPIGPIRPFVEWQVVGPFGLRESYLTTGFTVRDLRFEP